MDRQGQKPSAFANTGQFFSVYDLVEMLLTVFWFSVE